MMDSEAQHITFLKEECFFSEMDIHFDYNTDNSFIGRLTDALIAILQDTGNYICNWSMARPLVWGNPESQIGGKPIKDFALGPPQLVFPKQYISQNDVESLVIQEHTLDFVGFNYKYGGYDVTEDPKNDCSEEWANLCKAPKFYNPLKRKYISIYSIFDYAALKLPFKTCDDGEGMIPGDGQCRKYICNKYDSFTLLTPGLIDLNGSEISNVTCTKEDPDRLFIAGNANDYPVYRNVSCVHPELFCRAMKLSEMHFVRDPFDPDLSVKQLDDGTNNNINSTNTSDTNEKSNNSNKSNNIIKIVVPCVVVGVIIIVAIIITVIVIRKKRQSNEDKSDNEIELND